MKTKKKMSNELIDLAVASVIGGSAINIVSNSGLPNNLGNATGSVIGLGLLKKSTKLLERD